MGTRRTPPVTLTRDTLPEAGRETSFLDRFEITGAFRGTHSAAQDGVLVLPGHDEMVEKRGAENLAGRLTSFEALSGFK
jgi:hypothetical protein